MPFPLESEDPVVVLLGDDASAGPEVGPLSLACRFYGFRLVITPFPKDGEPVDFDATPGGPPPVLVAIHSSALAGQSLDHCRRLQSWCDLKRIPLAVVGLTPDCDDSSLRAFAGGRAMRVSAAAPPCGLWVQSAGVGSELRGLRFALGSGPVSQLECAADHSVQVLATVGPNESARQPALLRVSLDEGERYFLARTSGGSSAEPWRYRRENFGEVIPYFLLLRDAGGARCWLAPAALANLTIDDPWLKEPYGCLSFVDLLGQMRREHFHATIGFVPWNYDRSHPDVVALFRANPEHLSIAIHGNNHDRYEFFRYEARAGDQQRAKPLAEQFFNVRQALGRMEAFHEHTGLDYDRVMVFPHGISPGPTLTVLQEQGFWITSNYSNVPLDGRPPPDPAVALRSANTEWSGFPALRREYPHNYSEEAIAIDLFLGNPVLFMAHQDLFFDGIEAFNPVVRRVNDRQPAVRWTSLGEISRHLHRVRWPDSHRCEVQLVSDHARITNPKPHPVEFRFTLQRGRPEVVERISVDDSNVTWENLNGGIHFRATLAPGATGVAVVHRRPPGAAEPVALRRRGFRHRTLRFISDFRDLTLSRSVIGRFLTRKYYVQGKRRPTVSGLFSKLATGLRGHRRGRGPATPG